jgi:hypothetical protein
VLTSLGVPQLPGPSASSQRLVLHESQQPQEGEERPNSSPKMHSYMAYIHSQMPGILCFVPFKPCYVCAIKTYIKMLLTSQVSVAVLALEVREEVVAERENGVAAREALLEQLQEGEEIPDSFHKKASNMATIQ